MVGFEKVVISYVTYHFAKFCKSTTDKLVAITAEKCSRPYRPPESAKRVAQSKAWRNPFQKHRGFMLPSKRAESSWTHWDFAFPSIEPRTSAWCCHRGHWKGFLIRLQLITLADIDMLLDVRGHPRTPGGQLADMPILILFHILSFT